MKSIRPRFAEEKNHGEKGIRQVDDAIFRSTDRMSSSHNANDNVIAPSEQKHVTPVTIAVDLVLVAIFFFFMFGWVKPHVASNDPKFANIFGALTAICVTGVFWMAIQMFRVVVAGEKTLKAERSKH